MRPLRHSKETAGAFTLLEVLIAVVIFAIVLVAIHGVLYGAIRLRNTTAASMDEALPIQQALAIIKRDLANIVPPGGALSGMLQSNPTVGLMNGQASPEFFTASGVINETSPWAEVQKISYLLVDSTNQIGGKDLVRTVTRNLLPSLQEEPAFQWLMSGVEELAFAYYDGTQWADAWDSTAEETPLPQAIKLQIVLATQQNVPARLRAAPIELVVPIYVQAQTNQSGQAEEGQL